MTLEMILPKLNFSTTWAQVFVLSSIAMGLWAVFALLVAIRNRHRILIALSSTVLAGQVVLVFCLWWVQGECLLPHPDVVEYHGGMTLCPGQSARLTIEVPIRRRQQSY